MRQYPSAAAFLGRMGYPAFRPGIFGFSIVERDVERAAELDLIPRFRLRTAMDFVVGPVFSAMAGISSSPLGDDEIADLAYRVLLAIGAGEAQARTSTSNAIVVPVPSADGLLERSSILERIVP
jgi:hypothetical protein